jgi:hypothetical protein
MDSNYAEHANITPVVLADDALSCDDGKTRDGQRLENLYDRIECHGHVCVMILIEPDEVNHHLEQRYLSFFKV